MTAQSRRRRFTNGAISRDPLTLMILTYVYRKRERSAALAICLLGRDDQMLSERAFETVDRDMPVTVHGNRTRLKQTRALAIACNGSLSPSPMNNRISLAIC